MVLGFSLRLPKANGGTGKCSVEELRDISEQLLNLENAIRKLKESPDISFSEGVDAVNKLLKEYEATLKRLYECTGSLEGFEERMNKVRELFPLKV